MAHGWPKAAAWAALIGCTWTLTACDEPAAETTSPLDEFRKTAYGDTYLPGDDMRRELDAKNARYSETVATCMNRLGFDFQLETAPHWTTITRADDVPQLDPIEYATRYGYLVSDGVPDTMEQYPPRSEVATDPNAEYVAAMSPQERSAYMTALGEDPAPTVGPDAAQRPDTEGASGSGCRAEATAAAEGTDGSNPYRELEEQMLGLTFGVEEDAAYRDVLATWSSCMVDEGYDAYHDPIASVEAVFEEYDSIDVTSPSAKAAFREREFAQAIADATCQVEVGLEDAWQAVLHEREQRFADEHRSELMAWAAWKAEQLAETRPSASAG